MNVNVTPSTISGEVVAPPSKSYAHRILISAFLSGGRTSVYNAGNSNDVSATLSALKSLGAQVETNGDIITIERKNVPKKATVDCNESGSTLRFLLPVACALNVNATFTGKGRLLERPIKELVCALNDNGAEIDGFTVNGKLKSGEYKIPANISSQYLTGLLFALPILSGDSKIVFIGTPVSTGYLDVTLDVLKIFGIQIEKTDYGYYVRGNQMYKKIQSISVEGDYSGSAFIFSLGAITGSVKVTGLKADSLQGDARILDVLKRFGAEVIVNENYITVSKRKLNAVVLDCQNIPDLVQIIAVVGAYSNGVTILKNVERLRLKESDRIQAIINQLNSADIKCRYDNGDLYIYGGMPKGAEFSGGNDHRTVMSATVLGLGAKGNSFVIGAEPVNKSYTNFYKDVQSLGGNVDVVF